jgi:hypothetical protein
MLKVQLPVALLYGLCATLSLFMNVTSITYF